MQFDTSASNKFSDISISSDLIDAIKSNKNEISKDIDNVLSFDNNNDDNIEKSYKIIQSYFEGKQLSRLVRHQIESYNHFINYQIEKTIDMFNPVVIRSENDYIQEYDKYTLEINISFDSFKFVYISELNCLRLGFRSGLVIEELD